MTRFTASANNFDELTELLQTATLKSTKYGGDRLLVMSNGSEVHLIHSEYRGEFEADGYWLAMIYENGHRVEI